MRLHWKLALSFAVILFVLFGLTTILSLGLVTQKFDEESRRRTQSTLEFLNDEYERLRQEALDGTAEVAREPALLAAIDALARGEARPESPEITFLGADLMARSRLEMLELLDDRGTILTIGHWPVYAGHVDSAGLALASMEQVEPRVAMIRGEKHLTVQSARRITAHGKDFVLVGGELLDERFVDRLEKAAGDEVLLYFARGGEIIVSGRHPERQSLIPRDVIRYQWRWRQGRDQKDLFVTEVQSGGKRYSLGTVPLLDENAMVIGEILVRRSDDKLLELLRELKILFILLAAAGVFIGWAAATLGARTITRPLENLSNAVSRAAASGGAPPTFPERGDSEIAHLAKAWNAMGRELEAGRARLARMERIAAWRDAARRIAHEIRNALYPIRLSVDTIERARAQNAPRFEELLSGSIESVRSSVADLQRIVDEFSAFARWPEPKKERCDVNALLARAAETFALDSSVITGSGTAGLAPAARETGSGVRFTVEKAENLPEVDADPGQIVQLLTNLLKNARDAVGDSGEIRARTGRNAKGVFVEIADTGPGMEPEVLARAREPYFTQKTHGTGLGLAIAQQIADAHGGALDLSSEPGRGTTASVTLPPAAPVALTSAPDPR